MAEPVEICNQNNPHCPTRIRDERTDELICRVGLVNCPFSNIDPQVTIDNLKADVENLKQRVSALEDAAGGGVG